MEVLQKHFLDTSVARPMLVGTRRYKAYFTDEFGDAPGYISKYVQMEFKRSYLCNVIAFYFLLRLDSVPTIGEALKLWSNRYQGSALKAILQLTGDLFDSHHFDPTKARDKQKALDALGRYIKRLEIKLRGKFKDIGVNNTRCARALVNFNVSMEKMAEGFRKFIDDFDDVQGCRSRCVVDDFLIKRHNQQLVSYVQMSASLPNNEANRGFKNIVKNLNEILQKGPTACTCKMCEKIGDAIIALETPRNMRLEHTDISDGRYCDTSATDRYYRVTQGWTVHRRSGGIVERKCITTRNDGVIVIKISRDFENNPFIKVTID